MYAIPPQSSLQVVFLNNLPTDWSILSSEMVSVATHYAAAAKKRNSVQYHAGTIAALVQQSGREQNKGASNAASVGDAVVALCEF